MARFKEGQRVRLKPDPDEGWDEEFGTILEDQGDFPGVSPAQILWGVEVDEKYRVDELDDGIREVAESDLEEA